MLLSATFSCAMGYITAGSHTRPLEACLCWSVLRSALLLVLLVETGEKADAWSAQAQDL
jgi:hypothetical protein